MSKPINPIWSIERALCDGYVMEPHRRSSDFSGPLRMSRPSHDCALVTAQIRRHMSDPTMKDQHWGREACAKQCDECASICHMNDYIRAKPHCPPNYPMPAIPLQVKWFSKDETKHLTLCIIFRVNDGWCEYAMWG